MVVLGFVLFGLVGGGGGVRFFYGKQGASEKSFQGVLIMSAALCGHLGLSGSSQSMGIWFHLLEHSESLQGHRKCRSEGAQDDI